MPDATICPDFMLIHEGHHPHKRRQDELSYKEDQQQTVKKRKTAASSRYSPEFWDTLSKVHLTRSALQELDRRQKENSSTLATSEKRPLTIRRTLRSDSRILQQVAAAGGLDLNTLRGYSDQPNTRMSISKSSSSRLKRSRGFGTEKSSIPRTTKGTSAYDGNFLQKMIDIGVYPDGYDELDVDPPEPNNIEGIHEALNKPRRSLSPSRISNSVFTDFKRQNRRATSETQMALNAMPYITGSQDRQHRSGKENPWNNLQKFDPSIVAPQPDAYYGASPAQIDRRVRDDLNQYIVPSSNDSLPMASNFFREDKSVSGRVDVVQRQAMYDGAVGARAMWHLQNYGNTTPVYDGNAYTITSTYHNGHLQIYTTHPGPPSEAGGNPQYYMTQLDTYGMTGNINTFCNGARAYRNAREWTKEKRDQFINAANAVARSRSTETRSFSRSGGDRDASPAGEEGPLSSETSADELSLEYDTSAKRQRRRTTH